MMANSTEDEIAESWEELEDSGELDKRINKDIKTKVKTMKEILTKNSDGDPLSSGLPLTSGLPMLMEDSLRTQYQPQVKILKRRPDNAAQATDANKNSTARQMKTLEQREAEYAEARMRIFGESNQECTSPESNGDPEVSNDRPERLQQQMDILRVSENTVARQPRGPDGSKGFSASYR